MAAPSIETAVETSPVETPLASKECDASPATSLEKAVLTKMDQTRQERRAQNQEMVQKYHSMFPEVPTMTSEELVARWKEIDRLADERDDSQSDESDDENENQPGPLLLIDVRSKAERQVSMIQGSLAMDDLETQWWINKYVHNFDGFHKGGTPTIVTYCTIGYRSGREAQHLIDELTGTFGYEIGKSVEIKNLDGILAYSFVEDVPPLLRPCRKGSSDSLMTRRIHTYGKDWSEAVDPSFETVYFESKPQKALRHLQLSVTSAFRMLQHQIHKSTTKAKKKVVEPVANMAGTSVMGGNSGSSTGKLKRISSVGYTENESMLSHYETASS